MAGSFQDFDKPYRRGLVLGLSWAELFLILLFLLLVIATGLAQLKDEQIQHLEEEVVSLEKIINEMDKVHEFYNHKINELTDQLQGIYDIFGSKITLEEFSELVEAVGKQRKQINELNDQLSASQQQIEALQQQLNTARVEIQNLAEVASLLEDNKLSLAEAKKLIENSKDLIEALSENQALFEKLEDAESKIEDLQEEITSTEAENQDLTDKNEKMAEIIRVFGIDPPCWHRPRPGSTENQILRPIPVKIFEVLIKDNGLKVRLKDNSDYAAIDVNYGKLDDKSKLSELPYNKLLSKKEFLNSFTWLRDAGDNEEIQDYPCKFNVDLYDGTSPGNKAGYVGYKEQTVEQLFNTFRPNDPPRVKW